MNKVRKFVMLLKRSCNLKEKPWSECSVIEAKLFPILDRCLSHFITIPKSFPHFEDGPLKGVSFVIDTTATPIPNPTSKQDRKLYYCHKKNNKTRWAMKTQAAIGLDLRIWNV